jgi:hypothetical protein
MAYSPERMLGIREATEYLRRHGYNCGDNTLTHWRTMNLSQDSTDVGPKVTILGGRPGSDGKIRFGKIRYTQKSLDSFLQSVGKKPNPTD